MVKNTWNGYFCIPKKHLCKKRESRRICTKYIIKNYFAQNTVSIDIRCDLRIFLWTIKISFKVPVKEIWWLFMTAKDSSYLHIIYITINVMWRIWEYDTSLEPPRLPHKQVMGGNRFARAASPHRAKMCFDTYKILLYVCLESLANKMTYIHITSNNLVCNKTISRYFVKWRSASALPLDP